MRFETIAPPPTFVETREQIVECINRCSQSPRLGVDTETWGKPYTNQTDQIIVMSLSPDKETRYMVERENLPFFKEMLERPDLPMCWSNVKFDLHRFANANINITSDLYCTVYLDWLLDEDTREGNHGLKGCAWDHLKIPMQEYKLLFGKTDTKLLVKGHPLWDAWLDYSSLDAWASRELVDFYERELSSILVWHDTPYTLWDMYKKTELKQLKVLFSMERKGINLDLGLLSRIEKVMSQKILELDTTLIQIAGEPLNLNSSQQVMKILYREHKPTRFTEGGAPSTDADALELLAYRGNEFARVLLERREYVKIRDTYCVGLAKLVGPDGKLHTEFTPTQLTGRLSAKRPSVQNQPTTRFKDPFEVGVTYSVRDAFIADEGCVLIVLDYSQLEMCVLAEAANDQELIEAINNGLDMHCQTAALMFGLDYAVLVAAKKEVDRLQEAGENVPDELQDLVDKRAQAKAIGFGIVYGKTAYGLAIDLKITRPDAEELLAKYLDVRPAVKRWLANTLRHARKLGYVQTITGRFRRLSKINHPVYTIKKHAENQAANSPIQGTAADIVKIAMIKTSEDKELQGMGCSLLLQVHDELVYQVPEQHAKAAGALLQQHLENPFEEPLAVKLRAKPKIVRNWGAAK